MSYTEPNDDLAQRIEILRVRLESLEAPQSDRILCARLARVSPLHPARIMRNLCGIGILASALAIAVTLLLPALSPDDLGKLVLRRQAMLPVSIPAMGTGFGFVMLLSRVAATKAMAFAGRSAPLLPREAEYHRKLTEKIRELESTRAFIDVGTSAGHPGRGPTPEPFQSRSESDSFGPPPQPSRAASSHSLVYGLAPLGSGPSTLPSTGAAHPSDAIHSRSATPGPTPLASLPSRTEPGPYPGAANIAPPMLVTPTPAYTRPEGLPPPPEAEPPQFDDTDDPRIVEAFERAVALSTSWPVQASIEYLPDRHTPFALVLERATPAMAVRTMVAFVDFLGSIATPPRALISLRSVVHVDRGFHRNVKAALEPHFPDNSSVSQRDEHVEITFLDPDPAWKDYCSLPTSG